MRTDSLRLLTFVAISLVAAGCGKPPAAPPPTRATPALGTAANPIAANPNAPPAEEKLRPARELLAASPLDIERKAPLAEFSQRIALARKEQKVLPCGHSELDRLYHLVVSRGFQGASDSQEVLQQLDRWLKEDSANSAPRIALARATLNQAYAARGAEYGNVVSQRRLERFELLLRDAHQQSQEALAAGISDPEVYRLLLDTGFELKLPPTTLKPWMEEAVRLGPRYYPLYEVMAKIVAVDSNGKYPMLARLAREALVAHPGDDGLEIYARIAQAAHRSDPRSLHFSGFDLKTLNGGVKVLLKRYPQAADLIDFIGVVAVFTDDVELGREILPELKSRKPNLADWGQEWNWHTFQTFVKRSPLRDKAQRVIWPGLQGAASAVFIDRGRHLATTGHDRDAKSLCVWPLTEQDATAPEAMPHLIQTEKRVGTRLDADRQGERLLVYEASHYQLITHMFDLSQGKVPDNMLNVRWYRPRLESDVVDPRQAARQKPERGFFEISEDGQVAVAFASGQVELFEPLTGKKGATFPVPGLRGFENSGRHLSPDGRWLALQGQDRVELWDCQQGLKHCEISDAVMKTDYLMGFAGLLAGQSALVQSRQQTTGKSEMMLGLWDWEKQQLVRLGPLNHRAQAFAVLGNDLVACAAPLAPGINQPVVTVYRLRDGKAICSMHGFYTAAVSGRFSPDGKWLATYEMHGPVRLWKIPVE